MSETLNAATSASGQGARRALIFDDDPLVASTLAAIVRSCGHTAEFVNERVAFIESCGRFKPDVIVLDLSMPGHDGLDSLRHLAAHCTAEIILASGAGRRTIEAAARLAERQGLLVLGCLEKPFGREAVARLLGSSSRKTGANPSVARQGTGVVDAGDIEHAFTTDGITAFFQPILCLKSSTVNEFEALARFDHPGLGVLPPACFLPRIFDLGLGWVLLERMLLLAADFLDATFLAGTRVAINVTPDQVKDPSLRWLLDGYVEERSLDPARVLIELNECGSEELSRPIAEELIRLSMAGYRLAVDDFGSGASGLHRLMDVPFAELKIDRSFLRGMPRSLQAQDIFGRLVDMGKSLGMSVTAEGVEDEATLEVVRRLGCDKVQGFYVARPLPSAEALRWAGHPFNGPTGGTTGWSGRAA